MTSGCSGFPKLRQLTTARRPRADAREVRDRLGEHERGAARVGRGQHASGFESVVIATPARRRRQPRATEAQQRGVATGSDDGVQEQLVVVLAVDPRGVDDEAQAGRRGTSPGGSSSVGSSASRASRSAGRAAGGRSAGRRRRAPRPAPRRGPAPSSPSRIRSQPDRRCRRRRATARSPARRPSRRPPSARTPRRTSPSGSGATIASMRSWLSEVMTSAGHHRRLAARHRGDVDVHAEPGSRRGLARRAREPRAAQVLDPDDEARVEQLEARLDEPLLLVGVADLDARALRRRRRRRPRTPPRRGPRRRRCRRGRSPHPSRTARLPTPLARPSTSRSMGSAPMHRTLTSGLPCVAGVEGELAADRWDADRVAVARDARRRRPRTASAGAGRRARRRTGGP